MRLCATVCLTLFPMLLGARPCKADDGRAMLVGFDDDHPWRVLADDPWWAHIDIRNMLNVFHPLSIPRTGNAAGATCDVTIPTGWTPPFALRFYCADDYFADADAHKPGQLGTESFFDHRFKQVLINDRVVWERDVIDENTQGSQTIFDVDITPDVKAGETFALTFRVLDRVSTTERNARDVWFIGGTWYTVGDGKTEEQPRFHTAAWFADPAVGEKDAINAVPPGIRPTDEAVVRRHHERWPMPPPGDAMPLPATFALVSPADVPAPGFPVTCGIPLPPGALSEAGRIGLRDPSGEELPVQVEPMGWWPDGSLRWVLVNAVAPAGVRGGDPFTLHTDVPAASAPSPLSVNDDDGRIEMDTGVIRVVLGGDPERHKLIDAVFLGDGDAGILESLTPRMSVLSGNAPTPVDATLTRVEVVERGPVRARIEVRGSLDTAEQHIGSFTFRLYAYAGLPTLNLSFRILDEVKPEPYAGTIDDAPLRVTDLALVAILPGRSPGRVDFGVVDGDAVTVEGAAGSASLIQSDAAKFAVQRDGVTVSEGRRAQGWVLAETERGAVEASVWGFWQQFPKSLTVGEGQLALGLFSATEAEPAYPPRFGEAKRHDILLNFAQADDPEAVAALGLLAAQPPRLFDGDWFCRSGGVSALDPNWFSNHPQLADWVAASYGDISSDRYPGSFGIRDFGDMPYKPPQWRNGYWAMVQGPLNWGLASGDQRWLERAFEIARHIADVDTVHLPDGHPDWAEWNGVTCALGADHSVHDGLAKWPAFQVGESLVLHYWLTGDPDSLAAAVENARYIIRSGAGLGSSSARDQARPMLTLLRVWAATGDPTYRDAATRYFDLQYQAEHVIDWRRGAYIQPTYQNWRCVSAGLDSMYALNVYDYYRMTGDLDAARLVAAVADSLYAESMLPQEEAIGSFVYYVRYSRNSWYYTQMALLFHAAYDLTGDTRFLRAGRAAFARYLLCRNADGSPLYQTVDNMGWLDPEFGGWERLFADVPTAPLHITSQTPDPDPSAYAQ